jgi:hypothetical protein
MTITTFIAIAGRLLLTFVFIVFSIMVVVITIFTARAKWKVEIKCIDPGSQLNSRVVGSLPFSR